MEGALCDSEDDFIDSSTEGTPDNSDDKLPNSLDDGGTYDTARRCWDSEGALQHWYDGINDVDSNETSQYWHDYMSDGDDNES